MVDYAEWERSVPRTITDDVLWKMRVFRLSMFVGELAWQDASQIIKLLLTILPNERTRTIREEPESYETEMDSITD